jgi:hypothetical protein
LGDARAGIVHYRLSGGLLAVAPKFAANCIVRAIQGGFDFDWFN